MLDKFPLTVTDFKGVRVPDAGDLNFDNASLSDINIDEAFDSINIRFLKNKGFKTRNGHKLLIDPDTFIPTGSIVGNWQVKNLKGVAQTDRFLFLTWDGTNGRLYDTGTAIGSNPILTVAGMKYAFVINAFGRVYLSPWSAWGVPLDVLGVGSLDRVYVWNGDYVPRLAQGGALNRTANWPPAANAPTSVANSATAGNVTPGTHLFDIAYEYDTGWISPLYGATESYPGGPPTVQPLSVVANGNQITINHIPTGAAGTGITKRHIIMSRLVTNYDNFGWLHYEPFFAATIEDNTTVGPYTFDKPDSGLVESAAYLLDGLGAIYSVVSMTVSGNRMIYYGPKASIGGTVDKPIQEAAHIVMVSPPGDPERVNPYGDDGSRLVVGRDFGTGVVNGAELRGVNYILKDSSTWAFREDINTNPDEWPVDLVDSGIGAFPLGVSKIGNSPSSVNEDIILVGGPSGIYLFGGSYSQVPVSLGWYNFYTYSITKYIQLFVNPNTKLIYVTLGPPYKVDDPTIDFYWVGDYSSGLTYNAVKWNRDIVTTLVAGGIDSTANGRLNLYDTKTGINKVSILPIFGYIRVVGGTPTNFRVAIESTSAADTLVERPIISSLETGYTPNETGEILTFSSVRIRGLSYNSDSSVSKDISVAHALIDETSFTAAETIIPDTAPKKFFNAGLVGAVGEKIRLKFSTATYTRMMINSITIFATKRGEDRAR